MTVKLNFYVQVMRDLLAADINVYDKDKEIFFAAQKRSYINPTIYNANVSASQAI